MNQQNQTQDKKIQILEATTALLSEHGLQALSFENVAKEVGLSRQLVRYYYTDLDQLMLDLCDHQGNAYRQMLVGGILEVGKVERLRFFLDFFFDLAEGHPMPANLEVYDAMIAFSVGSPALRDRLCDQYKTLGQVIIHELAIAYPELDGAACEELSFMFVSMMHAHWSFVASLGYSRTHSQLTRRSVERLITSYVKNAPNTPVIDRPWERTS